MTLAAKSATRLMGHSMLTALVVVAVVAVVVAVAAVEVLGVHDMEEVRSTGAECFHLL